MSEKTAARLPRGHAWARIKRSRYLYLMLLLPIIYYILFHYMPMYGVTIAFKQFNTRAGILGSPWVGLKWFEKFLGDPYFWQVLRNTLSLNLLDLVFGFPAPIILALLLNEVRAPRFKRAVQTVSYLPHFLSTMVVCGMLTNFLSRDGLINDLIALFGGDRQVFLSNPGAFRTIFVGSGIWQGIGWGSIIYYAGLTSISPSLYEAADMDGAGRLRKIWHISLPGLIPTIVTMLLLDLGRIMNVGFEKVFLMQNSSIYETADVISTYVYRTGMQRQQFSYASAVGLFNSGVSLVLILFFNTLARRISGSSLW